MARALNGEGSYRKISKDGEPEKWTGRKQFGTKDNGKPNIKAVYGSSEREVRKKMREYEKSISDKLDQSNMNKEILIDYLRRWFEAFKKPVLKKRTYDAMNDVINIRIEPYDISRMQMSQIRDIDLQSYINGLATNERYYNGKTLPPYSRESISKVYYFINSCLQYAEDNNDIPRNPMKSVKLPSEENVVTKAKDMSFFDYEEMKRIYDESIRKFSNDKYVYAKNGLAIALLMFTGLRIGEALALRYEDYDSINKILHVRRTLTRVRSSKTGKYEYELSSPKTKTSIRDISLSDKADYIIMEFSRLSPGHTGKDFILTSKTKNHLIPRNIRRTLNSIQETVKTKNQNSGLHTLRHSFCSYLIVEKQIPVAIVSAILGHADTSVTQKIYLHVCDNSKKDILNVFDSDF